MDVTRSHVKCISKVTILVCFVMFIHTSQGINLGLIAGDLKRSGPAPVVVRKVSHHSPVIINVHSGLPKLPGTALAPNPVEKLLKLPCLATLPPKPIPKLPVKPPPKLLKSSKVKRSPLLPSRSLLAPPLLGPPRLLPRIIPPVLPHLPLLPLIPPIMPPLLPILPPPLLRYPRLPLSSPFHPIKLPILGKSPLEKTLGTVRLPVTDKVIKRKILKDLLGLRMKGSLTAPEFHRFKKLLLK